MTLSATAKRQSKFCALPSMTATCGSRTISRQLRTMRFAKTRGRKRSSREYQLARLTRCFRRFVNRSNHEAEGDGGLALRVVEREKRQRRWLREKERCGQVPAVSSPDVTHVENPS